MSVAFGHPLSGRKRLFEDRGAGCGSPEALGLGPGPSIGFFKRPRTSQQQQQQLLLGPACRLPEGSQPGNPTGGCQSRQAALLRLGGMFPGVDEKIIKQVLDSNGDNIEAAIAQLHELRLSSSNAAEQQAATHPQHLTGANTGAGPECGPLNGGPDRLSPAWLDPFLKQFYESTQPAEAQARVAKLLEAFENAVIAKCGKESEELAALKVEFEKAKKDNAILCKAVNVQHSRLQELGSRDQEIERLRDMLAQYQDKLRSLELSNYSLAMHLQRATGPPYGPGSGGPPDVF